MNRIRLFGLLAAIALALPLGAGAATRLSANAGEVRDIKYASGTGSTAVVYAASQGGGVFKSTTGGQTWSTTGLSGEYAWSLAVSPLINTRVYAATDSGLWRTTDGGTNWTQLTFDPARAVAVDPGSAGSDTVLLGVTGIGILRSTTNGDSFVRHSSGLDSTDVTRIVYGSAGTAYAVLNCNSEDGVAPQAQGNWGGIFRATNANAAASSITWTNYNGGGGSPLPSKCVRAAAATGASTLYVGVQDPFSGGGLVYKSTGAGWDAGNNLFGIETLTVDRLTPTIIHAGTRALGVHTSTNSGVSYGQKSDPTQPCCDPDAWTRIYAIEAISATRVLIAAKGAGIMYTDMYTTNPVTQVGYWNQATGMTADRVRGLANHANPAGAGANANRFYMALENGAVARSDNAGTTWTSFFSGLDFGGAAGCCDILLSGQAIGADPSNQANVLLGTRGGGFLQLNGGQTGWTTAGVPANMLNNSSDYKPQQVLFSGSQMFVTLFDGAGASAGGLLRSTTGISGLTQTVYPGDLLTCVAPATATGSAFKVVPTSGNRTYLLRYDAMPYRSLDGFASNAAVCVSAPSTGYERLMFHDMAEKPSNTAVLVGATSKGVFRSTDSGANWARVTVTGLQSQVLAAMAYVGNNLFAVERAGRVYCSADDGTTWNSVSTAPFPQVPFRDMKVVNNAIHVLTDGGGVYTGFAPTCP